MNEFSKVVGYKIYRKKQSYFYTLAMNNLQIKIIPCIKKKSPSREPGRVEGKDVSFPSYNIILSVICDSLNLNLRLQVELKISL